MSSKPSKRKSNSKNVTEHPTSFEITFNVESAAVLLRCLDCGLHACSQEERDNGIADVIDSNVALIQHAACRGIHELVLSYTAKHPK